MAKERREVHFSGRVQGVGFRYTSHRLAGNFDVTGYVKNLPQGEVLLVAEGDARELDGLLQSIQTEMRANIDQTRVNRTDYQGEFGSFDIRH